MLVVLILVAVALGPVWGRWLTAPKAYIVTTAGWIAAMAIVLGSGTVKDIDAGFWIFNSALLVVGLGLTHLAGRWRSRQAIHAQ